MSDQRSKIENYVNTAIKTIYTDLPNSPDVFIRPIDDYRIRRKLQGKGTNNNPFVEKVTQGVSNHILEIFKYYKKVFSLHPANPNKQEVIEMMCEIYIGDESVNRLAELIEEASKEAFKNQTTFPILVIGPKGSGKSTTQNILLSTQTHWIQENLRLCWFRCDAHKLYKLWEKHSASDVTLEDYLKIQLAYVVIKYGANYKNKLFGKIIDYARTLSLVTYIGPNTRGEIKSDIFIDQLLEKIEKESGDADDSAFIKIIDNSLCNRTIRRLEYNKIIDLSDMLKKIILSKYNMRIMYVVDGVDNILWHKARNANHYIQFIKTISETAVLPRKDIWVFSIRPETLEHMKFSYDGSISPLSSNLDSCPQVQINTINVKELIQKKVAICKHPKSSEFVNSKKNLELKMGQTQLKHYDDLLQDVSNDFIEVLETLSNTTQNSQDPIQYLFRSDIRECSQNLLTAFLYQVFMQTTFNDFDIQSKGKKRFERLIYRNLFLHGELFKNTTTENDSSNDSPILPNLFWYDISKVRPDQQRIWYGLCGLRILQTIYAMGPSYATKEAVSVHLVNFFDYDESIINNTFDRYIQCGLISYKLIEMNQQSTIQCTLSDRGIFMISLLFRKIDLLYFMALDTPLLFGNLVACHNNQQSSSMCFTESVISTGIWMLHHIQHWHKEELKYINSTALKVISETNSGRSGFWWSDTANLQKIYNISLDEDGDNIVEIRSSIISLIQSLSAQVTVGQYSRIDSILETKISLDKPIDYIRCK
ncbi:MAG: hypothetical protein HQL56_15360 [Magnetococcales bacterium]|nr:hypothetical protein [Magnetococcales bacterium]